MKYLAPFVFALGCGATEQDTCPIVVFPDGHAGMLAPVSPNCIVATLFAARDSPELTPSLDQVALYLERWSRAVEAEPILVDRGPQRLRGDAPAQFELETSNPAVIASWTSTHGIHDAPLTGDASFDEVMGGLVRPELNGGGNDTGRGTKLYGVLTSAIFNEELLHERLLSTSSNLPESFLSYRDNGTWTWDQGPRSGSKDATAQIDFSFGWGDCFVQCDGMHDLRAIVPPDEPARVFDLGGDPLPPFLTLSPDTLPL